MRGLAAAGLAAAFGTALVGLAVVSSAVSFLGGGVAAHGELGRHHEHSLGPARPLPAGGGDLPGAALDRARGHRHRGVGQRPVRPAGRPQRRQRGGRRGTHAVRASDLRRVFRADPAWRRQPGQSVRRHGCRLRGARGCSAPTVRPVVRTSPGRSTPTTTRRPTCSRCWHWRSRTPGAATGAGDSSATSGAGRRCRRRGMGAGADRHALRLGWRDAGGRLRLFGPRPGGLRRRGGGAAAGGPGPIRRYAQAHRGCRRSPRAISSSSGAGSRASTTSACTWAWSTGRTSWSTRPIPEPTSGPKRSPPPLAPHSEASSSWGRRVRRKNQPETAAQPARCPSPATAPHSAHTWWAQHAGSPSVPSSSSQAGHSNGDPSRLSRPSGRRDPRTLLPRRAVTDVLAVAALEQGHPVPLVVTVEADHGTLHRISLQRRAGGPVARSAGRRRTRTRSALRSSSSNFCRASSRSNCVTRPTNLEGSLRSTTGSTPRRTWAIRSAIVRRISSG